MEESVSGLVRRLGIILATAMPVMALAMVGVLSSAQGASDEELSRAKYLYQEKARCAYCHGWAGDGRGHPRSPGNAPSLRTMELDRESIIEVIKCGRPATAMPYHDRHGYRKGECYGGLTKKELGEDMPRLGAKTLQPAEIEIIVDYIEAKLQGRGKVTFEECLYFLGDDAGRCEKYRESS